MRSTDILPLNERIWVSQKILVDLIGLVSALQGPGKELFLSELYLLQQKTSQAIPTMTQKKVYPCPYCKLVFATEQFLQKHDQTCETKKKMQAAPAADKTEEYIQHIKQLTGVITALKTSLEAE